MKKILTVAQAAVESAVQGVVETRRQKMRREERIETLLKAVNKFPWNYDKAAVGNDTGRAYAREICVEIDNLRTEEMREKWRRQDRTRDIFSLFMLLAPFFAGLLFGLLLKS
jgi:hypothetical protein